MFTMLLKQFKKMLQEELDMIRKEIRESEALVRTDLSGLNKKISDIEELLDID